MAADLAVVDYDTDNLEAPILSVENALERSSFFEVPSFLSPEQIGDLSKGMAEADQHIKAAQVPFAMIWLALIFNDDISTIRKNMEFV